MIGRKSIFILKNTSLGRRRFARGIPHVVAFSSHCSDQMVPWKVKWGLCTIPGRRKDLPHMVLTSSFTILSLLTPPLTVLILHLCYSRVSLSSSSYWSNSCGTTPWTVYQSSKPSIWIHKGNHSPICFWHLFHFLKRNFLSLIFSIYHHIFSSEYCGRLLRSSASFL